MLQFRKGIKSSLAPSIALASEDDTLLPLIFPFVG